MGKTRMKICIEYKCKWKPLLISFILYSLKIRLLLLDNVFKQKQIYFDSNVWKKKAVYIHFCIEISFYRCFFIDKYHML